jgi:hypothetical protein
MSEAKDADIGQLLRDALERLETVQYVMAELRRRDVTFDVRQYLDVKRIACNTLLLEFSMNALQQRKPDGWCFNCSPLGRECKNTTMYCPKPPTGPYVNRFFSPLVDPPPTTK